MASFTESQSFVSEFLAGTPGNDKHSIKLTGKGVLEADNVYADLNTLDGGDGKNKFDISAKHSGIASIYSNYAYGGMDADKLKFVATSKSSTAEVLFNEIDLGDGKDSVQIDAKAGVGRAKVLNNQIEGGDGDVSVKLTASNKGGTEQTGYSFQSNDAAIGYNAIYTGTGKDQISLTSKSGDASALIGDDLYSEPLGNTISAGDGNDKIKLIAQNKGAFGYETHYDGSVGQDISIGRSTSADISSNDIDGGNGDDAIELSTKSGIGIATSVGNTISGGDGENSIKLSAQNKGMLGSAEFVFYDFESSTSYVEEVTTQIGARIASNVITGGDDNDEVSISAKSTIGTAQIGGFGYTDIEGDLVTNGANEIHVGGGDNEVLLSSSGTGATEKVEYEYDGQTYSYNNYVSGSVISANVVTAGDGEDSFELSAKSSKSFSDISTVDLSSGAGADSISVSQQGLFTNTFVNMIDSGEGDDVIDIVAKAKRSSSTTENTISGGDGADTISITGSSKYSSTFGSFSSGFDYYGGFENNFGNLVEGGDGDDSIAISLKANYATIAGNTISGGEGNDTIDITLAGKFSDSYFNQSIENLIEGGDGSDIISLDLKSDLGEVEIQDFLENNTIDGGDGVNDTLEISSKKQMINLDSISGNLLNMEVIDLAKSKSTLFLNDDSVIAATDTDNVLLITGKGSVEFGGAYGFDRVDGDFTYFDLGTSQVGIENSIDVIESIAIV